jgi:hypothetical protein
MEGLNIEKITIICKKILYRNGKGYENKSLFGLSFKKNILAFNESFFYRRGLENCINSCFLLALEQDKNSAFPN